MQRPAIQGGRHRGFDASVDNLGVISAPFFRRGGPGDRRVDDFHSNRQWVDTKGGQLFDASGAGDRAEISC